MRYLRPVVVAILFLATIAAAWIWWSLPSRVDMVDYAPADAVVYLEFNSVPEVIEAIQQTDVWRNVAPITHSKTAPPPRWLKSAAQLGIGSAAAVILARAQVALVVLSLNSTEQEDSLAVRPEFALVIETHTSRWRTKPIAIDAVKRLSTFAYGTSNCTERNAGVDYIECSAPGSERKIVGAVDGTFVVIGNSAKAVQSCLEVRSGARPSLRTDGELLKVRKELISDGSLGFGYISQTNSAKILSLAAPLMLGKAPSDGQFEKLLQTSASKILRGVAWTATSTNGSINDHYLFVLEPDVVSRLQPAFEVADVDIPANMVPLEVQSASLYRSKRPVTAWSSLDLAIALKVEALPAVLLSSILKSSLSVYGISDPKELLSSVSQPLMTLRPSASATGSILLARVGNKDRLQRLLSADGFSGKTGEVLEGLNTEPKSDSEYTAVFHDEFVLMGKTEVMRSYLTALRQHRVFPPKGNLNDELSPPPDSSAAVVTYSKDESRLISFVTTLLRLQGRELTSDELGKLQTMIQHSSLACTQTSLKPIGIERKTRSAFGQFSNLTSLFQ